MTVKAAWPLDLAPAPTPEPAPDAPAAAPRPATATAPVTPRIQCRVNVMLDP